MPSDRTTVTELGTGLGMLGLADVDEAVRARTPVMHSLSPEMWERLARLRAGGAYDAEFHAAWANGQAFLAAADGLRGRLPNVVEWKGTGRAPGDEVAPIDLRVDHVYLVSCKYLSNILFNVSPSHVFDDLLAGGPGRAGRAARGALPSAGDWYAEVAPTEYQALYDAVRAAASRSEGVEPAAGVPPRHDRTPLGGGRSPAAVSLPGLGAGDVLTETGPPEDGAPGARRGAPAELWHLPRARRGPDLGAARRAGPVAPVGMAGGGQAALRRSVGCGGAGLGAALGRGHGDGRWGGRGDGVAPPAHRERALLRPGLLDGRSLRLRIATSWDWRQQYRLIAVSMEAQAGGQPRVGWEAVVRDRVSDEVHEVAGHIEVRWSHGRFGGLPEAKGYLDTPHHLVPGYYTLR